MADTAAIGDHYASDDIAGRVLAAVRAALGPDAALTPEALAPADHFHGGGLAATRDLAAMLAPRAGERLLDIGAGVGGPARWIAATFGCHVTALDLTPAFCRASAVLTATLALDARVRVVEGSALDLPFDDASFDRAYSQNVVMNIADKARFFAEAFRVLRPGGAFALAAVVAGPGGPPHFPVPWASGPAASFLSTAEATRAELTAAGFEIQRFTDTTDGVGVAQNAAAAAMSGPALPALGTHLIMGPRWRELQANGVRSRVEGRVGSVEALVRKP
ncbi:MAG: class I SAM-dependent methyltransferase [Rhodospirillales bacterium]|nr:MAG: class I SAM-dependent methyltransferase [Rhodospirillales bacterium]